MKIVVILLLFVLTFVILFLVDKYQMNRQKQRFYNSLHKGMDVKIKNRNLSYRIVSINRNLKYITCTRKGIGYINFRFEQLQFTPKSFLFNA